MNTEEGNIQGQINQNEMPQPVRMCTQHVALINILEPTMRGKTYRTNNLITQTVEVYE